VSGQLQAPIFYPDERVAGTCWTAVGGTVRTWHQREELLLLG